MYETSAELTELQQLMDASYARSTAHLRSIVTDDRRPTATRLVQALQGMKLLSLATVTARGEPRISAVDGHFLHSRWTFSTDGGAAKARHLRARPSVSAAHLDGERLGVFCHGRVTELSQADPFWDETMTHWIGHYGSDPHGWGEDIRMYRVEPSWFVAYGVPEDT